MVTVEGTINASILRPAEARNRQNDGKPYISFPVSLFLANRKGDAMQKEITINIDQDKVALQNLLPGKRVEVKGTAHFRKTGPNIYVNFSANEINLAPTSLLDKFSGQLYMIGKLGKVIMEKHDCHNNTMLLYSCRHTDVISDKEYEHLWVNLTQFKTSKSEWMVEKATVELIGVFEPSVHKTNGIPEISLSAIVADCHPYAKPES